MTNHVENPGNESKSWLKIFDVTIDFQSNFEEHISNVCKKASHQLNVLKRICGHL